MNEFFGLSMTYIMIGLLVVLAIAVASIGYVLVRNRIMFMVGVRNIPRRRAQTTLIIVGLMLSTVIISTAFSIGDTAEYSITTQAYDSLHSVDEVVQAQTGDDESTFEGGGGGGGSLLSPLTIEQERADTLVERFRTIDGVDGAMNVVRGPVAVQNQAEGLAEPLVVLVGVDSAQIDGFQGDFTTLDGAEVTPADLADGEIFVNESAADELAISPGNTLTIYAAGTPHEFTVRDILTDRVLTGAFLGLSEGMLLPIDRVQEMFERPGEVDFIAVSNDGGVRSGVELSDDVVPRLNALLGNGIIANDTKQEFVEDAEEISSFMVTFFVVLGLFSIAAGMMLIFLIFVMLAAERKVEMGMMRAVGTKRSHLIQSFISEGMVYNVGAAAVGCAIGILVSMVMIRIMAELFEADLGIQFNVTARSLVVAYSIGVVLTFLTVVFSSWRIGNLNIVSAIRDIPDEPPHRERPSFRSPLRLLRWIFFKPSTWRSALKNLGLFLASLALGALGIAAFFVAAAVYGSAAGSILAVVLSIVGGIIVVVAVVAALAFLNNVFQTGPIAIAAGILLFLTGLSALQAFPFAAGLTLMFIGAALIARTLGAPARPVFTTMGLSLLVLWLVMAGNNVPGVDELEGDIEMFFLSGISMVLAGTFVIVYNADLLLHALTLTGGRVGRWVPAIKTAVAYPLANQFRTGMTIAMIALVMFALVMMSTMNSNFERVFLNDDSLAGYDVVASENPGNPIGELRPALRSAGFDDSEIQRVEVVREANSQSVDAAEVDGKDTDDDGRPLEYENYAVRGLSDGFMQNNELGFQARATGFGSDDAVWDAMLQNPEYAVVDSFAIPSGGLDDGGSFGIDQIEPDDTVFDPVEVSIRDNATDEVRTVTVIGVLSVEGSALFGGILITEDVFDEMFERPQSTLHFIRLNEGADADEVAQGIERTLLPRGVQSESLRSILDDIQAQQRGFLYLIQGFMGIGLFVGIAAVGVVAFRTVVERRQQIGMLRAIGYTRRTVALSFIMESSFTTLMGILCGVVLGLLLAQQLVKTDDFVTGGVDSFYIPWLQILVIATLAFVASLIMTLIPSRQASSIPIAEALRYE